MLFFIRIYLLVILACFFSTRALSQALELGTVVTEHLSSTVLRDNLIGLDTNRSVQVYLPPGYPDADRSYPVVYYCHSVLTNPEKLFADGNLINLLDRGFAHGVVDDFILVAADYSTPTTGSVYENSPVSGRWLNFTVQELVPFIDAHFRTLPSRDSRAVVGDFMGGRGALKLAMTHAEVFSVVYALHPVATGTGRMPWVTLPIDWKKIHLAQSLADLGDDVRTRLFVTISQGFLPNLDRPPFYCDFFMEMEDEEVTFRPENARKIKAGFQLEETLDESAVQLRTLRGLAFDWGRFDPIQDHVYANQAFSQQLEDLGVEHEAEEYRGDPWNRTWTDDGRFYTRLLPFLNRHLIFEAKQ